jgi:hypothetical protein
MVGNKQLVTVLVTAALVTMSRTWSEKEDQKLQGWEEEGQGEKNGRAQVPLWRDHQQEEERLLGECACVHIHVCVWVHVCTCLYTFAYVSTLVHMCAHVCTRTCVYVYMCAHLYMCVYVLHVCM